jgi:hypothetical protein
MVVVAVVPSLWGFKTGMQAACGILPHHLILISLRRLHSTNIPPLPFTLQAIKRPGTDPRELLGTRVNHSLGVNVTS